MNQYIHSFQKNKIGILFMLAASFSTAIGQLFWKMSAGSINFMLIAGFFFYFVGAVLMIVAFRFGSLSVLHPLLSMGYVFALFFGVSLLHEAVTVGQLFGTGFIIIGAILIGGGDH